MRWKTRKIPERIYWRGGSCGNCNGREALLSYLSPQFLILYFPHFQSLIGLITLHQDLNSVIAKGETYILLSKLKTEIAKNGMKNMGIEDMDRIKQAASQLLWSFWDLRRKLYSGGQYTFLNCSTRRAKKQNNIKYLKKVIQWLNLCFLQKNERMNNENC